MTNRVPAEAATASFAEAPSAQPALIARRADAIHAMAKVKAGIMTGQFAPPQKSGGSIIWLDYWNGTSRLFETAGTVAVINVSGVLLAEFPVVGWPYATGYNCLRLQLAQAFADPGISAIALMINSGGGDVSCCFDLVDWIMAAKGAAKKPVAALLAEEAYSAAYAIASAADSITVPRTGGVGSIGVVMVHTDYSGMVAQLGLKFTIIQAGDHKTDGNPFEALPPDVEAKWKADCEEIRILFAETVVRNRTAAGAKLDLKAVLATEAAIYSSPSGLAAAMKIGLLDEIMAPLDALNLMVAQTTPAA